MTSPVSTPVCPSTPGASAETGRQSAKIAGDCATRCRVAMTWSAVCGPMASGAVSYTHLLAAHEGTRWYLTEQGFLVSNSIINAVVEAGE